MTLATSSPRYLQCQDGCRISVLGGKVCVRLTGAQTAGQLTLAELSNDPGDGIPLHVHEREDETFHILEGQMQFKIGDRQLLATPGCTLFAPRLIPHSFVAVGNTLARMMVVITPGGMDQMFMELSQLPPGQPDMTQVAAICRRYGIHFP